MSAANDGAHATLTDGEDTAPPWFVCRAKDMRVGYRLLTDDDEWVEVTDTSVADDGVFLERSDGRTGYYADPHQWLRMNDEGDDQ